jgi:hypothetical protein
VRVSPRDPAVLAAVANGLIPADAVTPTPRRRKYRNVPCEVDGFRFDSKREADRWLVLKAMQDAGEIKCLRRQCPIRVEVNGVRVCEYVADFVYFGGDGREVVEDVKGYRTAIYKLKKKLVWAACGIDIQET